MRPVHDLAILGGGPAGIACALRAADQGASVLLCDPQTGPFDKPCGEGILPAGAQVLRELGIEPEGAARPFAGIRYCVPGAGDVSMNFDAPGEAWWRTDLHAALTNALGRRPGVQRVMLRADAAPEAGLFRIHAGNQDFHARYLVAADGAGGRAAGWLRPASSSQARHRVGGRARFAETRPLDRVEVHFGGGLDVYLTPLPHGAINVVVLADARPGALPDAAALIEAGLSRHPRAQACLGQQIGHAESRRLGLPWPKRLTDGRAFLIGDAGGAVDPILGAGMTIALRTGGQAADAVAAILRGARPESVARQFSCAGRSERRARRILAEGLQLVSRHDFLARQLARSLRLVPSLGNRLAAIAAGRVAVPLEPLPAGA